MKFFLYRKKDCNSNRTAFMEKQMLSSIIQSLYLRCKQNVESSFRTRNLTNAITNDLENDEHFCKSYKSYVIPISTFRRKNETLDFVYHVCFFHFPWHFYKTRGRGPHINSHSQARIQKIFSGGGVQPWRITVEVHNYEK